jgi:hypothetical protein
MKSLFDMDAVKRLSPYKEWERKNRIKVHFSPNSEETPWIAARTILNIADYATSHGDDLMGTGDTRDEAISDLTRKTNIKPFGL